MIVKPTTSFLNRAKDTNLPLKIDAIIKAMTGNPNYPAPTPPLPVVQAGLDDFTASLVNAKDGGKTLTAIKNARRKALVLLVRTLASYVQVACQGDYCILVSSGFPPHKTTRSPIGILPPPAGLALALGSRSGELAASVTPVTGSLFFSWRVTLVQTGEVVHTRQSSPASTRIRNLLPGLVYQVECSVSSTTGPSGWCASIPQMVI